MCPKCNEDYLIPLHKKRKDNDDFKCPNCNKSRNINNQLLEDDNMAFINSDIDKLRECGNHIIQYSNDYLVVINELMSKLENIFFDR